NLAERVQLIGFRGRIEVRLDRTVTFMKWPRPMIGDCPLHPVQRDAIKITFFHLHAEYAFAFMMCRRTHEVARTARITVAALEVRASHAPVSHCCFLRRNSIAEQHYTLKNLGVQLDLECILN